MSTRSVSLIRVVIEIALSGLGIKSFVGVLKFLGVLLESSLLVLKSLFDFFELSFIGSELLFGRFSESRNLSQKSVVVDLSLDLSLNIVF